jgi:hypothetical protein
MVAVIKGCVLGQVRAMLVRDEALVIIGRVLVM